MFIELTPEQAYSITANVLLKEADANANSDQPSPDFVQCLIFAASQFLDDDDLDHFFDVNPRVREVYEGDG